MSELFAIAEVMPGQLNALVKNIMRQTEVDDPNEAVRLVNSGEWIITQPARSWSERDGVIYFSVESDGTTGEEWFAYLEKKGLRVSDYAKSVLRSQDFKPTSGVTTKVAVLKGELFSDDDRITKKIRAEADKRKFEKPNAELACLIRKKFTDDDIKAMGLWWIVAMHEPIKDSDGDRRLLAADRDDGGQWLSTTNDNPGRRRNLEFGFAFSVPQEPSASPTI